MEQSDTITALATALAKAQATIEGAIKGKVNPAFKSKYADLSSVWDACREQLTANGLSVVQFPGEVVDGRMTLTTQLLHASGEWMRATMAVPLTKADAQGAGSAITYARRYALAAVVGVSPEDDDGNAASRPVARTNDNRQAPREPTIDPGQRARLETLLAASTFSIGSMLKFYQIDHLADLPAAKFDDAVSRLEDNVNAKAAA